MSDRDAVELFEDLSRRYPMAAAGLLEQLCFNLSHLLESQSQDSRAIAHACSTIAECFRPMDDLQFPDSYPWDAAYAIFGRWLVRGSPRYVAAVIAITGWADDRMQACRVRYMDMVRVNRSEWNLAAEMLDQQICDNQSKPADERLQ